MSVWFFLVTGVFAYKNHPICQVDLVGVIVRVIPKDRLVVYDSKYTSMTFASRIWSFI